MQDRVTQGKGDKDMLEADVNLREKIIAGLAACLPRTKVEARMGCKECPYRGGACEECVEMPIEIAEDMRALLKALEPRLMTLEEVKHLTYGTPYIVEIKLPNEEPRLMYGLFSHSGLEGNFVFSFTDERRSLFDVDYGGYWRCWTSEPTDEQRKATGWTHVA